MSQSALKPAIHPTAIVSPEAKIGEGTEIGAYSVIGPHVRLGKRNKIGPHVVIEGHTTIGDDNVFFQFASVGSAPQDLKYKGEPTEVLIGDKNVIREYVTIQPGTVNGLKRSVVGSGNLFMAGSHVGHDAVVGDFNVFANYCSLAGHVAVGSRVTIGGLAGVHQFVRLGDLAILGGGTMVAKDVPPFCMAHGDHARLVGLNKIGLKRAGFSPDEISRLKLAYRSIFFGQPGKKFTVRVAEAAETVGSSKLGAAFVQFLAAPSKRGLSFPKRLAGRGSEEGEE